MNGRWIRASGIIKLALVILFTITAQTSASHVPNEVILKFKPETPQEIREEIISQYNCSMTDKCMYADLYLLHVPESQTPEQMISEFENFEEVEYAELNYHTSLFLVPNDPLYFLQWNLNNNTYGGINIEKAWDIQTGDPNVVIAVLDSGIAFEDFGIYRKAPDLAQTRFVPGYDFVNNDSHPNDDQGHGTHVTGTIAQSTNNNLGLAGIAFNCSIMPVKVIGSEGTGNVFDIADGIYFAAANDANVINMSLGTDSNSLALKQAVEYAWYNGITLVCAAGNSFEDGNQPVFPAAYDEYCIAVGATRYDETRADYSNTGSYIDIVAPGGDLNVDQNADNNPDGVLQQTFNGNPAVLDYWFSSGTSSAAPHVSGAAALLISKGVTKPGKVRLAIEQSADELGPEGWDMEYGWGLLNIQKALSYKFSGDLTGDLIVDADDLAIFSNHWLMHYEFPDEADFNKDGIVNFQDFAIMANNWDK
ncbi:MAG: S8 family serine peptidase [Sedimentisphaerales bacterium]|nr:S8 family serine peptidase [Sedimentisphaerales bacterium]